MTGNVLRIAPAEKLCAGQCCIVHSDGKLLNFEHNHVNLDGGLFVYPLIETSLDRWLAGSHERKPGVVFEPRVLQPGRSSAERWPP